MPTIHHGPLYHPGKCFVSLSIIILIRLQNVFIYLRSLICLNFNQIPFQSQFKWSVIILEGTTIIHVYTTTVKGFGTRSLCLNGSWMKKQFRCIAELFSVGVIELLWSSFQSICWPMPDDTTRCRVTVTDRQRSMYFTGRDCQSTLSWRQWVIRHRITDYDTQSAVIATRGYVSQLFSTYTVYSLDAIVFPHYSGGSGSAGVAAAAVSGDCYARLCGWVAFSSAVGFWLFVGPRLRARSSRYSAQPTLI